MSRLYFTQPRDLGDGLGPVPTGNVRVYGRQRKSTPTQKIINWTRQSNPAVALTYPQWNAERNNPEMLKNNVYGHTNRTIEWCNEKGIDKYY